MLKFAVLFAVCVALPGCQATRDRQAQDLAEFNAAVKAQKKDIADVCERIQSDVQRRYCESEQGPATGVPQTAHAPPTPRE